MDALAHACIVTVMPKLPLTFDTLVEKPISLKDAAELIPGRGRAVHPLQITIVRWIEIGIPNQSRTERVRLQAGRLGGMYVTSRESIQRFMERLSEPASPDETSA